MPSSQELQHIADPPTQILSTAEKDKRIVLNLRPNKWSPATQEECRTDRKWQIRISLSSGLSGAFMAPEYAEHLGTLAAKDVLVVCCQDHGGHIFTVVDELKEVYWLDGGGPARGAHASIRFANAHRHVATTGNVWASFVLAIAKVRRTARPCSRPDETGEHFLQLFEKYSIT